jgi:hypothetical protein
LYLNLLFACEKRDIKVTCLLLLPENTIFLHQVHRRHFSNARNNFTNNKKCRGEVLLESRARDDRRAAKRTEIQRGSNSISKGKDTNSRERGDEKRERNRYSKAEPKNSKQQQEKSLQKGHQS